MKLVPLAVAAAVVAVTGITVWVGAIAREDTVVDRPYEEGLRYDEARRVRLGGHDHLHGERAERACDLGAGSCAAQLGDLALAADLGPRPLAAMRSLAVTVELRRAGAPVEDADVSVSFVMAGMDMGENLVKLAPAGAGRYAGAAVLVPCPSGRRDWIATFDVRQGGVARRAEVGLRLEE